MADDGLLVNFSLEDGPLGNRRAFKGGRWKDRLVAKKGARYRRQKEQEGRSTSTPHAVGVGADRATHADSDVSLERSRKRQRLSQHTDGNSKPSNLSKGSQEVISSLFSANPASKLPPITSLVQDIPDEEPSNAPLIDGLHTFTSLGLRTCIAAHLLTKLKLKAPTAIQKATISQLVSEDSDAFIQAETGSGKTLAYLLPIVQRIMELSKTNGSVTPAATLAATDGMVHRDSGLFAIILAPTRELCKQISVVLEGLLGCAHWIVAGTVIGGEKKKSEKARLRKGLNILVATPGRLADHLSNTKALDVSNVRWLVLDEGDRLMELGFEEEIRGIVSRLEGPSSRDSKVSSIPGLPARRTTVLCSATMKMNVQRLGEISLCDAVHIKVSETTKPVDEERTTFLAPAQLKQSYILVPQKQRLVTLAALLKRTFARKGSVMKAIVFVSCADSVDFHFEALSRNAQPSNFEKAPKAAVDSNDISTSPTSVASPTARLAQTLTTVALAPLLTSPANPALTIHKLHGSLAQHIRTATLSSFSRSTTPGILLCTDVASRGLDLPNIDLVIEYDPPFSADDHLHRIGRTARAGRDGRAAIFLLPGPEEGYVEILKSGYRDGLDRGLVASSATEILKKGFGKSSGIVDATSANGGHWEDEATAWQLDAERWVLDDKRIEEMARKAYRSHIRAYATHVLAERSMFDVKELHLGHLAKAFALRERPGTMGRGSTSEGSRKAHDRHGRSERGVTGRNSGAGARARTGHDEDGIVAVTDMQEAARKMRRTMNMQNAGAGEFNIG